MRTDVISYIITPVLIFLFTHLIKIFPLYRMIERILTFLALCVYPPIVAAIFAATGSREIHPDQVRMRAEICSRQMITHMAWFWANFHLLPRKKSYRCYKFSWMSGGKISNLIKTESRSVIVFLYDICDNEYTEIVHNEKNSDCRSGVLGVTYW